MGAVVGLQGVATAAAANGFDDLIAPVLVGLGDRTKQDETLAVQARAQWALVHISKSQNSISEL